MTLVLALASSDAHAQPSARSSPGQASGRDTVFRDPAAEAAPLAGRLDDLVAEGRVSDASARSLAHVIELAANGPRRAGPTPWLDRARHYLELAEAGRDPYLEAGGEITERAYLSPCSELPQGYAIYTPPDYDPARSYPLLVALHGGSTNGNLFLALALGERVAMADYRHRWNTLFAPARTPEWIVVAPDGFGNSMWRYLGERDVLDVIADVEQHYRVDPDRVVLSGLSNGGLGTYNVGLRHAWRFAAVVPMAGAPGWIDYLGGHASPIETRVLEPLSAFTLADNARNTHLHAHHGRQDHGRMQPSLVEALDAHLEVLNVPFVLDWYVAGHDLVGPVNRRDRVFGREAERRRNPRPPEVHLVTGDYRAARMAWVAVTRIEDYPALARVDATATIEGLTITTERARALVVDLSSAPLAPGPLAVAIDGTRLSVGPERGLLRLVRDRDSDAWLIGVPTDGALSKRPGLSGPIPDATYDRLVHVYGTLRPQSIPFLREAAERGARGWLGNLRGVRQPVIADTEVDQATLTTAHLVLYGGPDDNAILARIADRLPIRIEPGAITVGDERHVGRHLGVRFIYPSPLRPDRYVLVQASSDPRAVLQADNLPAFLPDWIIFDAERLPAERTNLAPAGAGPVAAGFFDDAWRLP